MVEQIQNQLYRLAFCVGLENRFWSVPPAIIAMAAAPQR
jgi:hypothetical protein